MFNHYSKTQSVILTSLMLLLATGLSACGKSEPPKLMKAVKQFDSDEYRDAHIKNMRKNHMDELLHKRDETMIKGIRTKEHSLKACISCHVPKEHNGKPLRHTDSEHFCSTCHGYVAQKLDCFQCHADRPRDEQVSQVVPNDSIHQNAQIETPSEKHLPSDVAKLNTAVLNSEIQSMPSQSMGEK